MYEGEKSLRDDNMKQNPKSPSFSSILLDEIYRKIDGNDEIKHPKEENEKKRGSKNNNGDGSVKARSSIKDEDMASFRRACLIEKWMEKKVNEKVSTRRRTLFPEFDPKLMMQDNNDPLFFSSGSNSSDSSFGFSSSETESFGAVKPKNLCFTAPKPKPVRTSIRTGNVDHSVACHEQSEFYLFDDYRRSTHQTYKTEGLNKSKTRAMKIYENIKKVKQPISPSGRLASFINNLISNGKSKKHKNSEPNAKEGYNVDRKTQASPTCSSASLFSRFYLSKDSSSVTVKLNNVTRRNEGSRHCSLKTLYDEDFERFGKPMPPGRNEDLTKFRLVNEEKCKKNEFVVRNVFDEDYNDEDYDQDDAASDSSSDLFELDHLALFTKNDKFCDDLPVYETTHLGTNHAIASGLIR